MNRYVKLEDAISVCGVKLLLADGAAIGQRYPTPDENINALLGLPTIEVSEGEWIVSEDGDSICSVCGALEEEFIFGTENWYGMGISNYCPSCGAKMKGEEE